MAPSRTSTLARRARRAAEPDRCSRISDAEMKVLMKFAVDRHPVEYQGLAEMLARDARKWDDPQPVVWRDPDCLTDASTS
jgi:hypothetical protein